MQRISCYGRTATFSPSEQRTSPVFWTWGGHAFEEGYSSRRVQVAPRVGSDDLDPLRESGGGSVHYERECALPAVLLPVSLPAEGGCTDIALASSQAVCVSSNQYICVCTVFTHSTLCTPIYTHNNMQRCSRLYISWIHKCHGCALDGIQW